MLEAAPSSRRSPLGQLLKDPLAGNYADAFCWALDAMEARAEKVRAALMRTAGRDFYDLGLLVRKGVDMSSASFLALVNQKLSELKTPPLSTFASLSTCREKDVVPSKRLLRPISPPSFVSTSPRSISIS